MAQFAVIAIGRDRPGIVAGISEALLAVEGNIEDSRMSILRGHFAVMLLVSVAAPVEAQELERRLAPTRDALELEALSVAEVDELEPAADRPSHVLSVYGADHPGIVHAVSAALAERGVNITDLQTQLAGSTDAPVYVMTLEIAIGDVEPGELDTALREVAARAEIEVSIRPLAAEAL